MEDLSKELELTQRVHFVGRQNREGVAKLFNSSLFFVLPSPVEPFGIVCLEAMRAGKPVVATNTGGPPEFIGDDVEGILVSPRDEEELFEAMQRLCNNSELVKRLGDAAAVQVQNFDWQKITEQYIDLYKLILKA